MPDLIETITIYSTGETLTWTVFAGYDAGGEVIVNSGDRDSEWNCTVPAENVLDLKKALIRSGAVSPESGSNSADTVDLLRQLFGGRQKNPFEEIREYLISDEIPFRFSSWIGL